MLFFDFIKLISDDGNLITYLRGVGFLKKPEQCRKCNGRVSEQVSSRAADGIQFKCCKCKATISARAGSFFRCSRLPLKTVACIIYFLTMEVPHKRIADTLGINKNTVTDYANLVREEYSRELVPLEEKLGGPDTIVQVRSY